MRPLFFVPYVDGKKRTLTDVGLAEFEAGAEPFADINGPDGLQGIMYRHSDQENKAWQYKPDEQTWLPACGHGGEPKRYYVGIWNDNPPTEKDLLRPDHRDGLFVPLADGNNWLITLPNKLRQFPKFNDDGTVSWYSDVAFNWLTTEVRRIEADRRAENVLTPSPETDAPFLCQVLQVNYRLTLELIQHLELLDKKTIHGLIEYLVAGLQVAENRFEGATE